MTPSFKPPPQPGAGFIGILLCIAIMLAGCGHRQASGPSTVSLTASTYSVARDTGMLTLIVERQGDMDDAISTAFTVRRSGAEANPAVTMTSGTLHWDDDDSTAKFIAVPIRAANVTTGETLAVTLSQPAQTTLKIAQATVHVVDPVAIAIRVQGKYLLDASGNFLQLRGVNTGSLGGMYALSNRVPDDPWMGYKPDWQAMQTWGINSVRITLNEASLLGLTTYDPIDNTSWPGDALRTIGMPRSADPGKNYQQHVIDAVNEATAAGMYVILDMHMSSPDDQLPGFATKVPTSPGVANYMQQPMAGRDHGLDFWKWVATTFKSHPNVIFDLFNEPYFFEFPPGDKDAEANWRLLRDGATVPFYKTGGGGKSNTDPNGDPYKYSRSPDLIYHSWEALGMQEMLNTVRAAGASNVVMIGGVGYAGEMSLWLKYRPVDPLQQMVASWHGYHDPKKLTKPAWGKKQFEYVADIAEQFPVIIGELGDHSRDGTQEAQWASTLLPWADRHGLSYLGWCWDPWGSPENVLIKDKTGTPTDGYGKYFRQHLLCVASGQANCP